MDLNINMSNGGSTGRRGRGRDDAPTNTIVLTGWKKWAALGAVLALFGGLWFFFRDNKVEPSPAKACAEWARVRNQVHNSGDASASVQMSLDTVRSYARGSAFERQAREIANDYDDGTVDMFDVNDLDKACKAYL